ncbi:MAG: RNA polymerase sigma factor, partial [Eubacterium sp.]|nr:RNA polymerase sigma factor [Eubacterium sp.]
FFHFALKCCSELCYRVKGAKMLNVQTEKQYIEIVEKYADMIYRIAYQKVLNRYDAEDIVQDVFVKLLSNKSYFRDEEHMKAWLIRVTINLCINYNKSLARQKTVSVEQLDIPFTQQETGILEELYLLPEDERNILYLYYYEGYKIREIAKILRQKQNTINSKLTRARNKLKKIMEVNNE